MNYRKRNNKVTLVGQVLWLMVLALLLSGCSRTQIDYELLADKIAERLAINNVAIGKTVYADSENSPGESARFVNDGRADTKWNTSTKEIPELPHWIVVDLGKKYRISKFVVKHAGASRSTSGAAGTDYRHPEYNTKSFKIQSSETAEEDSWVDEVTVNNNPPTEEGNITVHAIPFKVIRYVRLYITEPSHVGRYARIYEFEIWGSEVK